MERFLTKVIRFFTAIVLFILAVVILNLMFVPAHFISLFVKDKEFWRVPYFQLYKISYRNSREIYINGFPI